MSALDPHGDGDILWGGADLIRARALVLLIHGRGASAQSMMDLFNSFKLVDVAAVAPEAVANTWYPHSFLMPLERNQPYLDSALKRVETVIGEVVNRGIQRDRIILLGFSQGACLASEFVARKPRTFGGVVILTGGVIGPLGMKRSYGGNLDGVPIFMGSSDPDPHVPFARVEETAGIFRTMGATVELRRYPGMPHTINEAELAVARGIIETVAKRLF